MRKNKIYILYFFRFLPRSVFFFTIVEWDRAPKHSSITEIRRRILKFGVAKVTGFSWLEY